MHFSVRVFTGSLDFPQRTYISPIVERQQCVLSGPIGDRHHKTTTKAMARQMWTTCTSFSSQANHLAIVELKKYAKSSVVQPTSVENHPGSVGWPTMGASGLKSNTQSFTVVPVMTAQLALNVGHAKEPSHPVQKANTRW